jgi:pimeloyl-ACP methyl ester carboxylesterase
VDACGTRLGASAALYGSGLAADDLAAVLDALGIHKVDLCSDSYGTFFAQAFAGRHPQRLRSVVLGAAYAVRELDAAARAWSAGDTAPLLRLVAENQTSAFANNGANGPRRFSAGVFTAISCADYTQIYRMTDPVAQRAQQAAAAIAAKKIDQPEVYAPFSIDEFLSMPQDYSVLNLCQPWPVSAPAWPPGQPVPPGAAFTSAPVLVLSGEFDSLTPPAQGAQAADLFPQARQVLVPTSFHVSALGDLDQCASTLLRLFVQDLSPGDAACAEAVPAYRLLPRFARRATDLAVPGPVRGNQATPSEMQAAAAL